MLFVCCATLDEIEQVQSIGYDRIEFSARLLAERPEADIREARRRMDAVGLGCLNLNDYCGGVPAIVGPRYDRAAAVEYAKAVCERAAILGARTVGIGAPMGRQLPDGYDLARADEEARDFLAHTAEVARPYGLQILWESLNDRICNYGVHLEEAVTLVDSLALDNVGLVIDQHHMAMMAEPVSLLADAKPYIWHTHLSRLADTQRGYLVSDERPAYLEFLRMLHALGYDRTASVEAVNGALSEGGAPSLALLRELWTEVTANG